MKNHLFNIVPKNEGEASKNELLMPVGQSVHSGVIETNLIENLVIDAISPSAKERLFSVRDSALSGDVVAICMLSEFFTKQFDNLTVQQMIRIVDERVYAESGTLPRQLKLFFREGSVYLTRA